MYKQPAIQTFQKLEIYKEKAQQLASKEFDNLVNSAEINVSKNTELYDEYNDLKSNNNSIAKKIKALKVWRWFLIIFLIFPFILMTKKIKQLEPELEEIQGKIINLENELSNQVLPLLSKVSVSMVNKKILKELLTDFQIDENMESSNIKNLETEYANFMEPSCHANELISGQVFEHPFVLFNKMKQDWHEQVYTGTLSLPYVSRMSNGATTTSIETVVATVTKPAPDWTNNSILVYKTTFSPSLFFTNNITKKQFKQANKKEQVALENKHFNKVCPIVRNSEQEIRVIFTPLTQENFVDLFEYQQYYLTKNGNVTTIDLPGASSSINQNISSTFSYSIEEWKNNFINWVVKYVNVLGVFSLPIANMPTYYQLHNNDNMQKPNSALQIQSNTDYLMKFLNISFPTQAIYSIKSIKEIKSDKINFISAIVSANYFNPVHKIVNASAMSIHHGMVIVPVDTIDYIPESQDFNLVYSINLNSNEEINNKNYSIHNGQIMKLSSAKINVEELLQKLK